MNSQAPKRPPRVLCVEDDPIVGEVMLQLLAREGYWVAHSEDGRAAWHRLSADLDGFHVIVTDNQMPHWDGLQLVRQLRDAGYRGQIVVHCSPLGPQALASYRALGVQVFVNKGTPADNLLRAVAAAAAQSN
jgi:CheY-like chemotaxis protein